MLEDMHENAEANANKEVKQFARMSLSWLEENMNKATADHREQSWESKAWDSHGPTVIQINRAIAGRVEVWYRVSYMKNDAIFEKRLEYPKGFDYDDIENSEDNQRQY